MNTINNKKATSLRINSELYAYIEKLAKKENRSLNNFIETILSKATNFNVPNKETIEAMEELKRGEGIRFDSVESLFESL